MSTHAYNPENHLAELEARMAVAIAAKDSRTIYDLVGFYMDIARFNPDMVERITQNITSVPAEFLRSSSLLLFFRRYDVLPRTPLASLFERVLKREFAPDTPPELAIHPHNSITESLDKILRHFKGGFFDDMKPNTSALVGGVMVHYLEQMRQVDLDEAMDWALELYNGVYIDGQEIRDKTAPINVKILEKYVQCLDQKLATIPQENDRLKFLIGLLAKKKMDGFICDRLSAMLDAAPDPKAFSQALIAHERVLWTKAFRPLLERAANILGLTYEDQSEEPAGDTALGDGPQPT